MGLLDIVGNVFHSVFGGDQHNVGPGFSFTPSGIIKQVGKLLPIISNAIPVIGPMVGQAVSAATTIFGGTQMSQDGNSESTVLLNLDEIKALIKSSSEAVNMELKKISDQITNLPEAVANKVLLDNCNAKLLPAIKYFGDNSDVLDTLTPYSDAQQFHSYANPDLPKGTDLADYRLRLYDLSIEISSHLTGNFGGIGTQQLFDIYLLAVSWLLIYDKTILTLWGYLAQGHLELEEYTDYIKCIGLWNGSLKTIRKDTTSAIEFLAGKRDVTSGNYVDGYIAQCRKARIDSMQFVAAAEKATIKDSWRSTALGYIDGDRNITGIPDFKDAGPENVMKPSYTAYYAAQLNAYDLATRPALLSADRWEAALSTWTERTPFKPESGEFDHAAVSKQIKTDVGGYPPGYILEYAVSYVSQQGEGFLSEWTRQGTHVKERSTIKVKVKRVMLPPNDYAKFVSKKDEKKVKVDHKALSSIVRRVYVKAAINSKDKIYLVGELRSQPLKNEGEDPAELPKNEGEDPAEYDWIDDKGGHVLDEK